MYIFRISNEIDGQLIYTFQDESWGKDGNMGIGITAFIQAFKKQYKDFPAYTTLTIMNDRGEFYHPKANRYLPLSDAIVIELSTGKNYEKYL